MKHIIWDNNPTEDLFEEEKIIYLEDNEDISEDEVDNELIWEFVYETIQSNLEAEEENLSSLTKPGEIFLIGTLERWDGSHRAYKNLSTKNVGEALEKAVSSFDGDNTFEISIEDKKMLIRQWGHDNPTNPSEFEFRFVKNYN